MGSLDIHLTDRSPLVEQIVHAISRQIDERVLPPGARLPSIRDFARSQKVSRFTVVEAYDRLVARGLITSRRGSGFYAANQQPPAVTTTSDKNRENGLSVASLIRYVLEDTTGLLKAGGSALPEAWMDQVGIRATLRSLARKSGSHLLAYGHPFGYLPLRQQLQVKLKELGLAVTADHVVMTFGRRKRSIWWCDIWSNPATPYWSMTPAITTCSAIFACAEPSCSAFRATAMVPIPQRCASSLHSIGRRPTSNSRSCRPQPGQT
jgi:DNA-binding transcriptional regulator YhcF (GntR family)